VKFDVLLPGVLPGISSVNSFWQLNKKREEAAKKNNAFFNVNWFKVKGV
jgi:hypothetical protein